MDMKTDLEILSETLLRYRRTDELSPQERLAILTDLEYYLHQVTTVHIISVYVSYLARNHHHSRLTAFFPGLPGLSLIHI